MKNIKKAGMERVDKGFSQKIVDKYTHLQLFTIHFAPLISTKRIIARVRSLQLVYAMPYLVLRREILNSFNKTKNILASIKQIWNIFVHLEFPFSRSTYFLSGSERQPSTGMKKKSTVTIDRMPFVQTMISSSMETQPLAVAIYQVPMVTTRPLSVIYKPSDISDKNQASYTLSSTSDFITPLLSFKPITVFSLSQMMASVEHPRVSSSLRKSEVDLYPYEHLERVLQNEQKIVTYQPPIVSHTPSGVSYKNLDIYMRSTGTNTISLFNYTSESPLTKLAQLVTREPTKVETAFQLPGNIPPSFKFANRNQTLSPTLGGEKAPLYHTYPEIEHVVSTHTETLKERVIEKEIDSKPPQVTPQLPHIDVNRLADQIYQLLERRVRIERERRGLYG